MNRNDRWINNEVTKRVYCCEEIGKRKKKIEKVGKKKKSQLFKLLEGGKANNR